MVATSSLKKPAQDVALRLGLGLKPSARGTSGFPKIADVFFILGKGSHDLESVSCPLFWETRLLCIRGHQGSRAGLHRGPSFVTSVSKAPVAFVALVGKVGRGRGRAARFNK